MAWQNFNTLTAGNQPLALFDGFGYQMSVNTVVKCDATGINAIVLTPNVGSAPLVPSYITQQHFSFVAPSSSTNLVTIAVGALSALKAYWQDGVTQMTAGDIVAGKTYMFTYNAALDTAAGGFACINAKPSAASGSGWVLIESKSVAALSSAIFNTGITATYSQYMFVATNLTIAAGAATLFYYQVSYDGGATWESNVNAYRAQFTVADISSATQTVKNGSLTALGLSLVTDGGDISRSFALSGTFTAINPSSVNQYKFMNHWINYTNAANQPAFSHGMTVMTANTATPVNAYRFAYGGGSFVSGTISLWGLV